MSRVEEALLERVSGWTILRASIVLGVVGVLPLAAYIAMGPKDGNPIGLGLIALAAVLVGGAGSILGVIKMLVEYLKR